MSFVDTVRAFDDAVDRATPRSLVLDRVMYRLSSAADHGLLWLGLATGRSAIRRDATIALRMGVILGVETALTNGVIKTLFQRVRPRAEHADGAPLPYGMHRPITSAFPSGHAATAFTAARVLSAESKVSAVAWYGLAGAVAWSRVYTRMHHASDVVAGAGLGLVLGTIARRVLPLEQP
jgi:membrane-associated phospholipid phosphatase